MLIENNILCHERSENINILTNHVEVYIKMFKMKHCYRKKLFYTHFKKCRMNFTIGFFF